MQEKAAAARQQPFLQGLLPSQFFVVLIATAARQFIKDDPLLDLGHHLFREFHSVRVDRHTINAAFHKEFGKFRIDAGSLPTEGDRLAIPVGHFDKVAYRAAYSQIAFIKRWEMTSLSRSQPNVSIVRSLEPME